MKAVILLLVVVCVGCGEKEQIVTEVPVKELTQEEKKQMHGYYVEDTKIEFSLNSPNGDGTQAWFEWSMASLTILSSGTWKIVGNEIHALNENTGDNMHIEIYGKNADGSITHCATIRNGTRIEPGVKPVASPPLSIDGSMFQDPREVAKKAAEAAAYEKYKYSSLLGTVYRKVTKDEFDASGRLSEADSKKVLEMMGHDR